MHRQTASCFLYDFLITFITSYLVKFVDTVFTHFILIPAKYSKVLDQSAAWFNVIYVIDDRFETDARHSGSVINFGLF
jgi:hypothetical protein